MFASSDVARFEALSLPGCVWCQDSLEGAAQTADAGEQFVGDTDTIDPTSWIYGYEGDTGNVVAQLAFTQGKGVVLDRDGEEAGRIPRRVIVYEMRLTFVEGFWRVADVSYQVVE